MNKENKKTTVRSHYLPITYLKHFLVNGQLFMYKKGEQFFKNNSSAQSKILTVSGEAGLNIIGLENNLYNLKTGEYNSDDIEEIFQEYGENTYDETISQIENLKDGEPIPQKIKDQLCIFMAAMRVRTPQFRDEIYTTREAFTKHFMARDIERFTLNELIDEYKKMTGESLSEERMAHVRDMFVNKKYKLEYRNEVFLQAALMQLEHHADIFHDMTMLIIKSRPDRYIITSDNPVVFFVPEDKVDFYNNYRSLMSRYTELYFPLSKNLCVCLSRIKGRELLTHADRKTTDIINYNISHHSVDFLFSPLKMKSLNQFVEEHIPYPFKFTIK